jgi:hypothetical protein
MFSGWVKLVLCKGKVKVEFALGTGHEDPEGE